jgi:PhnB protein
MSERPLFDRLDAAIDATLARHETAVDPELAPLVELLETLCDLPRPSFRARLKADLADLGRSGKDTNMTTTVASRSAVRYAASPRLRMKNAAAAIEFYKNAFGARELLRFPPEGRIAHAELEIGNSIVMVGEEAPDYGFPGPETLGGSPVAMHLYVDDADAAVERAVKAGARLVKPAADQFYGERTGIVLDPFGYSWTLGTRTEDMSVDEMLRRMQAMEQGPATHAAEMPTREGFHTVTPYLIAANAPQLIEFVESVFNAKQTVRAVGSAGGIHAEVLLGDSMVMIGGGAPDLSWRGESRPTALHVYVEDVDAAYARALEAGATSIGEPVDQPYGERGGGVRDASGHVWYIATAKGDRHVPPGLHAVNVYLHPRRAEPVIAFLTRAFGGGDVQKYASPDGVINHASVRIGDSVVEMGEAQGPYQPMPATFYLYVPDLDGAYWRALQAGATSVAEPKVQPYGERTATVSDVFGNTWYLATPVRKQP